MKNTERFSDRVSNYVKYRPSYPLELIQPLTQQCNINANTVIADVGSGTGKLTELLLEQNYFVFGVEPNQAMREAAEDLFQANAKFVSVAGKSEATELDDKSIDIIVAAQAFHWFEPSVTKQEFNRILKPDGFIALIWNQRDITSPFQDAYDQMLAKHCAEYRDVNHRNIKDSEFEAFFSPNKFEIFSFPYAQNFDRASFLGRMYSSSYTPNQGSREAEHLNTAAEKMFNEHEHNGVIEFDYESNLYLAHC